MVAVTRAEPADGPLSSELRALGLTVLSWPVLSVKPPADAAPLEQALAHAATFAWIVFTSQHAVSAVTTRLRTAPAGVKVAAVGARTAQALAEHGWRVDVVPSEASAAALVAALAPTITRGTRVLFPASSRALPTLAAGLSGLGARVCQVQAYVSEGASLEVQACREAIDQGKIAAVTFASPSAITELERALGQSYFARLLRSARAVTLGETTAGALAAHGFESVLADPATLKGLASTVFRLLQTRQ